MNSLYNGWLNSLAIVIMVINTLKTYIKENKKGYITQYEIFYSFLKRFSNYNYDYEIDINGYNKPHIQSDDDNKRFMIMNPIDNTNITKNSFNTTKIKESLAQLLNRIKNG